MDETSPLLPSTYDLAWSAAVVVGPLLVLAIVVLAAVMTIRRSAAQKVAGLDPETPGRSAESRLAEAADLHRRGLITADELGELRQRILSEV